MAKKIKETPILYGEDAENFLREIGELDEQPATAPVESQSAGSTLYPPRFCRGCDETDYMKFPSTNLNLCGKCIAGLNLGGVKK